MEQEITDVKIQNMIESRSDKFLDALPRGVDHKRFIGAAKIAILGNKDVLAMCRKFPSEMIFELIKCATDGLIPDKRQAAIVPFKGKPVYMPMVAGLKLLAEGNNQIRKIDDPALVYSNDYFHYEGGDNEILNHNPDPFATLEDRGTLRGGYCIAYMIDGTVRRLTMSIEAINKRRDASASKNGPWKTWYEEMCKKTILRNLCKSIPTSVDLSSVFNNDATMQDITPRIAATNLNERPSLEDYSEDNPVTVPDIEMYEVCDQHGEIHDSAMVFADAVESYRLFLNACKNDEEIQALDEHNADLLADMKNAQTQANKD
jgi:recombination protein RecT